MQKHHSKSEPILPGDTTNQQATDSSDVPVDTAKIQKALENRADQETASLPPLTLPDSDTLDPAFHETSAHETGRLPHKKECAKAHSRTEARLLRQPSTLAPSAHPRGAFCMIGRNFLSYKKARTGRSTDKRLWTPGTRSWFFTFMCMNMPVVGWFYLFYKARHEEDPARKEFARAYLFYKLVFLIAGLVVLLILIWIGLGLLDQLLAYMGML